MSDALQQMIDAVEINSVNWYGWTEREDALPGSLWEVAREADVNGSLNAAKDLHDAMLPEWRLTCLGPVVNFHDGSTAPEWSVRLDHSTRLRHVESIALDPARAWLLAILRAYQQVQQ